MGVGLVSIYQQVEEPVVSLLRRVHYDHQVQVLDMHGNHSEVFTSFERIVTSRERMALQDLAMNK